MSLPGEAVYRFRVGDKCETILPISELQDPFPIVVWNHVLTTYILSTEARQESNYMYSSLILHSNPLRLLSCQTSGWTLWPNVMYQLVMSGTQRTACVCQPLFSTGIKADLWGVIMANCLKCLCRYIGEVLWTSKENTVRPWQLSHFSFYTLLSVVIVALNLGLIF